MENDLVEKALERWKNCIPNGYLTWGRMVTGNAFVDLAQKYCSFSSEKSIMDLGPGYGRLLASIISKNIPFKNYTGVDISQKNIEMLKDHFKMENINFIQGSFSNVVLPSKYDIVISSLVLKHQYPTFYDSLKNILKFVNNDGILFFDLIENKELNESKNLMDLLELGPSQHELHESRSQSELSPWKKGPDTHVARYTKKDLSLLLENLSLNILSFDKVIHDNESGERLVVVAKKLVKSHPSKKIISRFY